MLHSTSSVDDSTVVKDTIIWLERAVIGLNFCPFAKSVHVKGLVHYAVSRARSTQQLANDLRTELQALHTTGAALRDTTLLITPDCLSDFLGFNDFLQQAQRILSDMGLEGVLQIASLHPHYQFADTAADDITNFTNRSPYPTLHLLRESSVERAIQAFPDASLIFENNMQTLRNLGLQGWQGLGIRATSKEDLGLLLSTEDVAQEK